MYAIFDKCDRFVSWSWHQMLQNGWNGKNDWDSNQGLLNLLSGASLTEVSGTADQLGWLSRKPKILT